MFHILFRFLLILPILLFAANRDQIIFPHNFHMEEVETICSDCHEGVETSTKLSDHFIPDMETCENCHDIDDCSMCHTNEDEADVAEFRGSTSGRDFNHALHLQNFPSCENCHENTLNRDIEEFRTVYKSSNCDICHAVNKPASHHIAWQSEHGIHSDRLGNNCSTCHTEKYCEDCHTLPRFDGGVHPDAYIVAHSFDARVDLTSCATCHEFQVDCKICHQQENVTPANHGAVDWTGTFSVEAGQHSIEAEYNLESCSVCHTASSCEKAGCHGGNE